MALDPTAGLVAGANPDAVARLTGRVRELERQVQALQRTPTIQAGASAPGGGGPVRDGTAYAQTGAPPRLWLYIGGGWHYAALT
jgi:hypothetical protein